MISSSLTEVSVERQLTPVVTLDVIHLASVQRISTDYLDRKSPLQNHARPGTAIASVGCNSRCLQS